MTATPVPEHPNLPRRGALALMFTAIVVSGIFGGLIGYGLIATSCGDSPTRVERMLAQVQGFHADVPNCDWWKLTGAIVGTILAAIGAGVVAILVMRAQSEWRGHRPR